MSSPAQLIKQSYDQHILPHLISVACGPKATAKQRLKVVPQAAGKVLEIGVGTGMNLQFYKQGVHVTAIDPSPAMIERSAEEMQRRNIDGQVVLMDGQVLDFDDASFDSVVLTYTLCTIPEPMDALAEIRRILKPGGMVCSIEHGSAPDANVRKVQDALNPVWQKFSGGCNLNRNSVELFHNSGFESNFVDAGYQKGLRALRYETAGVFVKS